jgi:hypothetical protein
VGSRIGAEESRAADSGECAAPRAQERPDQARAQEWPDLASARRAERRGRPSSDPGRPILASARHLARRGGRIGAEERTASARDRRRTVGACGTSRAGVDGGRAAPRAQMGGARGECAGSTADGRKSDGGGKKKIRGRDDSREGRGCDGSREGGGGPVEGLRRQREEDRDDG